jgi:hypothetical protein
VVRYGGMQLTMRLLARVVLGRDCVGWARVGLVVVNPCMANRDEVVGVLEGNRMECL